MTPPLPARVAVAPARSLHVEIHDRTYEKLRPLSDLERFRPRACLRRRMFVCSPRVRDLRPLANPRCWSYCRPRCREGSCGRPSPRLYNRNHTPGTKMPPRSPCDTECVVFFCLTAEICTNEYGECSVKRSLRELILMTGDF